MYQSIISRRRARGVTLLEVLISVLVLGVGLLGVAAMQANALKTNHSALQRSQAVMLAYFMLDAMRANRNAALAGDYDLGTIGSAGSDDSPVCTAPTGSTHITRDQAAWFAAMKDNLGDLNTTCGLIACAAARCTVKVMWDDERANLNLDQETPEPQIIEVSTVL